MYSFQHAYPTSEHEQGAQRVVEFFAQQPGVAAVLLTCSCARGKASADSCLDVAVVLHPDAARLDLEAMWAYADASDPVFQRLRAVGKYSNVDMTFTDGRFDPAAFHHGWTTGPDDFELAVGNLLVYCVPLWQRDDYFDRIRARWLPYYDENLRRERLAMARGYCLNNLHHIAPYVERGLYFQAFRRLYNALGEFLQALFISRRTYPIAYDKWIKEQIVEILELPALYPQLVALLETHQLESRELADKARTLENLLAQYAAE